MVDVPDCFFEFLENDCFLNNSFNLTHCFILISNFHYFLVFLYNFFYFFNYDWNLDYLLYNILNIFIHVNQLRDNLFDFNNSRNLNKFLFKTFNFVDFRNNN